MFLVVLLSFFVPLLLSVPLEDLTLPPGFEIEIYANYSENGIIQPRQIKVVQYDTAIITYVGTGSNADRTIRALIDLDGDNKVDKTVKVFKGEWWVTASVTLNPKTGDMYCAEPNQTYYCPGNVNEKVLNGEEVMCERWFYIYYNNSDVHYFHYMNFNPFGDICIAFGSNCNECILPLPYGTIQCFENNQILNSKVFAYGMRNSVGFDWHPTTNEMWFTENGRDEIGASKNSPWNTTNCPDDELNYVSEIGLNFGYPYCHTVGSGNPYQRDVNMRYKVPDPDIGYGNTNNCTEHITLAIQPLGPHVASLGMKFYTGDMFPNNYSNAIFIAEHGSWDRTPKIGYRVVVLEMSGSNNILSHEVFIDGFLNVNTQQEWGRPVDIDWLPDGSMLLSDDLSSTIYRIYYTGNKKQ